MAFAFFYYTDQSKMYSRQLVRFNPRRIGFDYGRTVKACYAFVNECFDCIVNDLLY